MSLKNKRILITAGPTWVAIDGVRIISNVATGATGMLLAQEAAAKGARVTLLLGSSAAGNSNKNIRIIRFQFFDELKNVLKRELKNNKYDVVIHSAAVSDFKPEYVFSRKLESDKTYNLRLVPLEKLVVLIRHIARRAKLVMFKLESGVRNKTLIQRAKRAQEKIGADLIVANCLSPYRAFIINKDNNKISAINKQDLARKLINILARS